MHWPTQGQWWSKRSTQLLQIEQWEHLGGRYSIHVWQYLTLTEMPLTRTSLVSGKPAEPCWPPGQSGKLDDSPMSSGSGGWAFLGMIPGSRPDVRSRTTRIWRTRTIVYSSSIQPITKLYIHSISISIMAMATLLYASMQLWYNLTW